MHLILFRVEGDISKRKQIKFQIKDIDNDVDDTEDEDDELDDVDEEDEILVEEESKMMFCYQDKEMKRLYKRYGKNLVLLDATYKTSKYSVPLFFLVVQGNVNYQVAAVFVCQEESTEMITDALTKIKGIYARSFLHYSDLLLCIFYASLLR